MQQVQTAPFKRSRTPEQKAARRKQLLVAAEKLFRERDPATVSLREIAETAGMTKANTYRYYDSKEAIMLVLYRNALQAWITTVVATLKTPGRFWSGESVAELLANSLAERPRLLDLLANASSVLERNVSSDFLREHTQGLAQDVAPLKAALKAALPSLKPERIEEFLTALLAVCSGLWPMAKPGTERLGTHWLEQPLHFRSTLRNCLDRFLAGCLTRRV